MTANEVLKYCLRSFEGTIQFETWGEGGIFYNPGGLLKRGVYVLTVKEADGKNDQSSRLDREGVFRINFGLRKPTYIRLFGSVPKRPPKGGVVALDYDFASFNTLMPHPVYAWIGWVCMLNPDEAAFDLLKPLLAESYEYAKERFLRRIPDVSV